MNYCYGSFLNPGCSQLQYLDGGPHFGNTVVQYFLLLKHLLLRNITNDQNLILLFIIYDLFINQPKFLCAHRELFLLTSCR